MGSHGHHVDFDAAHSQATRFNKSARLGTVGTVFHACCLLETTTNAFHIRMFAQCARVCRCRSGPVSIPPALCRPAESVPIPTGAVHAKSHDASAQWTRCPHIRPISAYF